MASWRLGGRGGGDRLGNVSFADKTSDFDQKEIEFRFFQHFLDNKGPQELPEAYVFETGANKWHEFDAWPPAKTEKKNLYVRAGGKLAFEPPADEDLSADAFVSDPAKPVPYTEAIAIGMTKEYMTDDQRFASHRPNVLSYQTDVLENDLTFAGPLCPIFACPQIKATPTG